ncbi:hypothetical protein [Rhodovulum sulfidophilum]|uniref:hypothetical protein n=1 Tax=Rhodovulum sulfidophilum TaxID=35806 RepID=UPI00117BD112|nr:hypothetical protein [Rhodovulum sulfidophilum]MBL3553168.1 hypothetical protein [Rhodovulum sulfidophilum]
MTCEIIWNEYNLLYSTYESFNQQSLTLKGWSVTVGMAAIIAVYSDKVGRFGRVAIVAAALSAIPFWIVDSFWKSYQVAFLNRLEGLENIQNCSEILNHSFGIVSGWKNAHSSFDWVGMLYMPNVALPHAFVFFLGLYLAWRHPPNPISGQ